MKPKKTQKTTTPRSGKKRSGPTDIETTPQNIIPIPEPTPTAPTRQAELSELPSPAPTFVPLQTYLEQLRSGELASRMAAAARLAEIGDPQAAGALQQALRDPTAEVAREAALAIAKGRLLSAVHALAEAVENRDGYFHPSVRIAAAESLGQIGDLHCIAALSRAVRDPLAEPSRAAIRALGLVAREDAVPVLVTVINNADNYFLPSVRVAAVEVLASLPSSAGKECLCNLVSNPAEDPEVRQAAALIFA